MNEQKKSDEGVFNSDKSRSHDHDARYLPRWRSQNRIKFIIDNETTINECETVDLSCSGVRIKTEKILMPGNPLKMKIYLENKHFVEVTGHVVWNFISPEGRYAGIHFDKVPLDAQELILNYAFEFKHDELVKHWFSR